MKRHYHIYSLIIILTCVLGSCNNDEDVDKAHSIFSTEEVERAMFDKWILDNYTNTYNIELKYRMEDNESDMSHVLIPAEYTKSVVLAKIVNMYGWKPMTKSQVLLNSYANMFPEQFTLLVHLPMRITEQWYWEPQKEV